jgi:serine/threonine-protein phosphatase 6 regulatory ankyrin repeat subunit B
VVDALLKIKEIDPHVFVRGFSEDYRGMNALHLASKNGHHAVIDSLLKVGVNPNVQTHHTMRYLPIHLAACAHEGSAIESVKILRKKNPGHSDVPDNYGQTALLWAAAKGNYAVVEFLSAKKDVNINARTLSLNKQKNKTALHWAAEAGHSEIVKLLLERGADARLMASKMNFLPIHLAIKNYRNNISINKKKSYLDTIKVFIEHDPGLINVKDIEGSTPLIWAVFKGNLRLVEYFLSRVNIDLNAKVVNAEEKSQNGTTALFLAADNGMSEIVQILLRSGAKCSPDRPIQIKLLSEKVQDIFKRHENMCKRKAIERVNTPFSFFNSSFGERCSDNIKNIQQGIQQPLPNVLHYGSGIKPPRNF